MVMLWFITMCLFPFLLQGEAKCTPPSVAFRSAPPTLSLSPPTSMRRWMALTQSSARLCGPTQPARSARPRAAAATWSSTQLCWASATSWASATAPRMAPRRPRTPRPPWSLATTTAVITTSTANSPRGWGAWEREPCVPPPTCSAACLVTPTLGLSRTTSRRARWRVPGHSSTTTICPFRWPTCPWWWAPVPRLPIRSVQHSKPLIWTLGRMLNDYVWW